MHVDQRILNQLDTPQGKFAIFLTEVANLQTEVDNLQTATGSGEVSHPQQTL